MHLKYVLQKNVQVLYMDIDINIGTEIYRAMLRIGWADHRF